MKDTAALSVVSVLTIFAGIILNLSPVSFVPGIVGLALAHRGLRPASA